MILYQPRKTLSKILNSKVLSIMVSQQLSLFDTATVVNLPYKKGDLVKVKRKAPHAPLLKKGDIVQIESIHAHNGSCKFWNELTESWGYLYPDEFVLIPPAPAGNDFVSTDKAQVVDTEYTVSPGNNDSVSTDKAQVVDTEYTVSPGNNDSVSTDKAQVVDTEYTVPPGNNDSVSSKAISIYSPRGTARSGEYFRFSYRHGSRMRHIHIRGGNTDSPIAQAKVAEVRSLLVAGISPREIAEMLKKPKPKL
jgi:hypothetical protein